jgi:NADP-dependent 3-hydroxy acid dehydrogenase YdfG
VPRSRRRRLGWPILSPDTPGQFDHVMAPSGDVVSDAHIHNTLEGTNHMSTVITGAPLAGRVAIATGASSGIGEATAFRLATLGAKVAVAARRKDNLDALVARIIAAGGTALALPLDVTDRSAVNAAAQHVADELGPVDLVFNNAGVQLISPIEDVKFDDWQRQIDVNITGVMNVIGAFVPQLIGSAEQGKPADLITTSSIAATRVLEKFSVYSGTKAYISQLTRLLRVELGRKMVRVSTIEPGMVDTELPLHVTDPDATRLMADLINDIDVLSAADVAETVAFIASVPRHVNLTEITILPTQQAV